MNCPFDGGGRLRNVEEKASVSGATEPGAPPDTFVVSSLGFVGGGVQWYVLVGFLCSTVGKGSGGMSPLSQVSVPVLGGWLPFPVT